MGTVAPVRRQAHWHTFTSLPVAWSRSEIGRYIDYCHGRVHDVLADPTEEQATALLPASHRYAGRTYAQVTTSLIGHTTAHAIQIRQVLSPGSVNDAKR